MAEPLALTANIPPRHGHGDCISRGDGDDVRRSAQSVVGDSRDTASDRLNSLTKAPSERASPRKRQRRVVSFKLPRRIFSIFYGEGLPRSPNVKVLNEFPRVYKIRNFLRKDQLSYFDKVCQNKNTDFQQSFTENSAGAEVVSEERTSRFKSFVSQENKFISLIEKKAADTVGLSVSCVEPLQLVMYSEGQMFGEHHDAGTLAEDDSIELIHPRRLVTFFVYLNDLPENEGCTEFPRISLTVRPERGAAILFCNVDKDGFCSAEMIHKANPVSPGLAKFGVNIWLVE